MAVFPLADIYGRFREKPIIDQAAGNLAALIDRKRFLIWQDVLSMVAVR